MMDSGLIQTRDERFLTLIEERYDYNSPKRGEICWATVLSVGENEVFVDLGKKRDGIVQRRDLDLLDLEYRASLEVGADVPVSVLDVEGPQGELVVSLNMGLAQHDWLRAQEYLNERTVFDAQVTDVNRGGAVVAFGRLRGFVPNSRLTSLRRGWRGERLQQAKQELVGQHLSLVVIEVDQKQRRLVLSQRDARRHERRQLLEQLTEGEVRTGIVCSLVSFGAFVDLGGLDGLIHISELDRGHVERPSDVLSVGDEVEVCVLSVDREGERIGLSRKRLLPDPWPTVAARLNADQVIEGAVTSVAEFGIFVDLGEGVEGLVHTSEIPYEETDWASLEPGAQIRVRVLRIDLERRRIGLSLKEVPVPMSLMVVEASPVMADAE